MNHAADKKRVLIVEDEPDIVRGLTDALTFEGFEVDATGLGREGVRLMRERSADCVILDLMLPDINGYQVCEQIRRTGNRVPIIMLTARSEETDKIRGLDAGADDYVSKPFSVSELLARVRAILRRQQFSPRESERFRIGDAVIDVRAQTLERNGKATPLGGYEVALLKLLPHIR
jgi:DNA-binding response OmpR family regulator